MNTQENFYQNERDQMPWYKHPWVWFIISLPSSVVLACMFTMYLAIVNAPEIERQAERQADHKDTVVMKR